MIIILSISISVLALLVVVLTVRLNAVEELVDKEITIRTDMITVLQAHDKYLHLLSEQDPKTEALQSYYDSIKGVA
jgi:hypothetical protein